MSVFLRPGIQANEVISVFLTTVLRANAGGSCLFHFLMPHQIHDVSVRRGGEADLGPTKGDEFYR